MLLQALRLENFRNIEFAEFEPHPRFNVFSGANGQGKTNLLESIYLLSAVKSFRPQTNQSLIRHEHDEAVLQGRVDRGGMQRIVKVAIGKTGKKVFLNNSPVRNLGDFFGTLNVIVFGPEDIQILKGSPSERRRFIDRAIFNARPGFAIETQSYDDLLKQRNAVLKSESVDATLLEIYDEQLIQYGSDIIERRIGFLDQFRPVLNATFQSIFDTSFEADLTYDFRWMDNAPDSGSLSRIDIEKLLEQALKTSYPEERARGFTVVGPHRDDLRATLNDFEVKTYASQGQHRAFVLAMKIAQIRYLEEQYGFAPILLLDDVSSELDRERNRYLFEFLHDREDGQVFITTTHRDYILLSEEIVNYTIANGVVTTAK